MIDPKEFSFEEFGLPEIFDTKHSKKVDEQTDDPFDFDLLESRYQGGGVVVEDRGRQQWFVPYKEPMVPWDASRIVSLYTYRILLEGRTPSFRPIRTILQLESKKGEPVYAVTHVSNAALVFRNDVVHLSTPNESRRIMETTTKTDFIEENIVRDALRHYFSGKNPAVDPDWKLEENAHLLSASKILPGDIFSAVACFETGFRELAEARYARVSRASLHPSLICKYDGYWLQIAPKEIENTSMRFLFGCCGASLHYGSNKARIGLLTLTPEHPISGSVELFKTGFSFSVYFPVGYGVTESLDEYYYVKMLRKEKVTSMPFHEVLVKGNKQKIEDLKEKAEMMDHVTGKFLA